MTYAWLLPALYSSHHIYQNKNKRHLWARPTSSEKKICDGLELLVDSRNEWCCTDWKTVIDFQVRYFRMSREDFENFLCLIGPAVTKKKTNLFFFLFVCKIVITRASPTKYTTGYLQGRTQRFRAKDIITYITYIITYMLLWPCRCYGAWFYSNSSWSEWTMLLRKWFHSSCSWSEWEILLRKLETLAVCMWCFRIRCGGRVSSTAGRLLENNRPAVPSAWRNAWQ